MVAVYVEEELRVETEAEAKHVVFKENLMIENLELDLEHKYLSFDHKMWVLKIHLHWKTKTRYTVVMGLKLLIISSSFC